tara:strand:+ start:386 stop:523 length:138 start_codon:yes stop_codon:yes gene_type:complete
MLDNNKFEKKILIGGCGFAGATIERVLAKNGYKIAKNYLRSKKEE